MTGQCPDCLAGIQIPGSAAIHGPITYYCRDCEKPVRVRLDPVKEDEGEGGAPRILWAVTGERTGEAIGDLLQEAGYTVRVAHGARETLDLVREFAPDIVLLDLALDRGGRLALLEAILQVRPGNAPRVLVVGDPLRSAEAIHRIHEKGAAGLIPRPALRDTVLFRVQSVLR